MARRRGDAEQMLTLPLLPPAHPAGAPRRRAARAWRAAAPCLLLAAAVLAAAAALAGRRAAGGAARTVFEAGGLHVELYDTGTAAMMNVSVPAGGAWGPMNNFSFVPETHAPRAGCFNLGDLSFRARPAGGAGGAGAGPWAYYSTAAATGSLPARPLNATGAVVAAHDVTALIEQDVSHALPAFGRSSPLRVVRSWRREAAAAGPGEYLVMEGNLTNAFAGAIEVGGLGLAMPAAGMPVVNVTPVEQSVWEDPHVGLDHGWVEFVRLIDGEGTLLAVPARGGELNRSSSFEAWRPVMENTCGNAVWELCTRSRAWAEDWAGTTQFPYYEMADFLNKTGMWPDPKTPWPAWHGHESVPVTDSAGFSAPFNEPRSAVLPEGGSMLVGVKFIPVPSGGPRARDAALRQEGSTAILRAVPGYVLSPRMRSAALLVSPPRGAALVGAGSSDVGVLTARVLEPGAAGAPAEVEVAVTGGGAAGGARASVLLTFSDGSVASAHYAVVGSGGFAEAVGALAAHWEEDAWLPRDAPDPFGRGASVMPYDRQDRARVLQDSRAYDVGLSDDAGGGNPLGLAAKAAFAPTAGAVSRISEFVKYTLYGTKEGLKECSCDGGGAPPRAAGGGGAPCDCQLAPFKSLQIRPEDVAAGVSADLDGVRMTMVRPGWRGRVFPGGGAPARAD